MLTNSPSDDPAGGVVLVQGVAELLPGCLQLLPEGEAVQHHGVPLVLQRLEDGGDRGGGGRLGLHQRRALDLDQLLLGQRLLVNRVHPVISQKLLDQTPLKNLSQVVNINFSHQTQQNTNLSRNWGNNRVLRHLIGDGADK